MFHSETSTKIASLCASLLAHTPNIVDDVVATAHYGLVEFDPDLTTSAEIQALLQKLANEPAPVKRSKRRFIVEMTLDGEDLNDLYAFSGVAQDELAEHLGGHIFTVAHFGFSPGFIYLEGLDPKFHIPRKAKPRTKVPAGSVAIGGSYLGIYSSETPGGWSLIGGSPTSLFDPSKTPPTDLLPGDEIEFHIVNALAEAPIDTLGTRASRSAPREFPIVLRAEKVQGSALLEDLGRKMSGYWAVPRAGAIDIWSHRSANALVGNPPGLAAVEFSPGETIFTVLGDCVLATTGSVRQIELDGGEIAANRSFLAPANSQLVIRTGGSGSYSYLGVAGGFWAPLQFQSRSRDILAGIGPPAISAGDVLFRGTPHGPPRDHIRVQNRSIHTIRTTAGPHFAQFDPPDVAGFLAGEFRVSQMTSRVGIRLEGAAISQTPGRGLTESQPLVRGAIQVPPSGEPMVMLADHPATGGYPVIAVVVAADLGVVGQARPGDPLHFEIIESPAALKGLRERKTIQESQVFGYRTYDELRGLGY